LVPHRMLNMNGTSTQSTNVGCEPTYSSRTFVIDGFLKQAKFPLHGAVK
jgi:hypothetical protein